MMQDLENECRIAVAKVYQLSDDNKALRARVAELEQDAARLDHLDAMNARKNTQNETTYGWRVEENHNRIALSDHWFPRLSVREAIDAAIAAAKP